MAERFASVSEDELCEKCIVKQLSNSQITQTLVLIIHDIMLNLIQQLLIICPFRPLVAFCFFFALWSTHLKILLN